jgi:hypothetical protein
MNVITINICFKIIASWTLFAPPRSQRLHGPCVPVQRRKRFASAPGVLSGNLWSAGWYQGLQVLGTAAREYGDFKSAESVASLPAQRGASHTCPWPDAMMWRQQSLAQKTVQSDVKPAQAQRSKGSASSSAAAPSRITSTIRGGSWSSLESQLEPKAKEGCAGPKQPGQFLQANKRQWVGEQHPQGLPARRANLTRDVHWES